MIVIPRFIRAKDAPAYLGMDRNKFNTEIRPKLIVIELGPQSLAYDRLDLDAIADDIKIRNGRPQQQQGTTIWQGKERLASSNAVKSGISINKSRSTEDFVKALDVVRSKTQSST